MKILMRDVCCKCDVRVKLRVFCINFQEASQGPFVFD